MNFDETIAALGRNDKVRRHGWMPGAVIFQSIDRIIRGEVINQHAYGVTAWVVSIDDLTATDWEIHVPDEGES